MKKQIVGIVVLMLVVTAVVSATQVNVKENNQMTKSGVDVPVWKKGDSWTYNEHYAVYNYNVNGTYSARFYWNNTVTYTVTGDTGDNYTVKVTSKNPEGRFIILSHRLKFTPFVKFSAEWQYRKTDLAQVHRTFQWKGLVIWFVGKIGLPFPAPYQDKGEEFLTPPMALLPFPLNVGTNGTLPQIHHTGPEKCTLYWGLITIFNTASVDWYSGPSTYTTKMENITVPAGTYTAFNVSAIHDYGPAGHDYWRTYYVPEIGYFAKQSINIDWNSGGKPYYVDNLELVSYSYTP
jgi:hypothetical protein